MAKKSDRFYFDAFVLATEHACRAAQLLVDFLESYDPDAIEQRVEEMHAIEHEGDTAKHTMMSALAKAFITPIEREDIIELSQHLDDVTDKIEDVMLRIYINNVRTIRPEAAVFARTILRCCEKLCAVMTEFADFKHSKVLKPLVIEVNQLEEEADRLFIQSMRDLHVHTADPLEIIAWREIFIYMERCADTCEHAADVVESVIMKNT